MVDLWTYQRNEIEQARLTAGEDEALETEKRVLANAEKLYAAALGAFDELYEGGNSAEAALKAAIRNVEELARYDARFAESAQQLASARATISDLAASLRDYAEGINASPERLAEIEDRLALLDRLKRKYGKTVAEVIAFGEDVARKLAEVEDRDEILKTLRAALEQAVGGISKSRFRAHRRAQGRRNETRQTRRGPHQLARHEVALLGLVAVANEASKGQGARAESAWTPSGWDTVEYLIAPNPGEPLKPLIEIASGGELSRILLALKVAVEESSSKTRKKTTPRTLVFDEIDIGIGGRAAEAVGHKLKTLGRGQQVLCVTHLPQIAAFADQHLAVEKREQDGRTTTRIRVLDDRARTHEVARMLSGAKVTDTSLQHAAQMIAGSR